MKVLARLEQLVTRVLKGLVQFYRLFFSAWLGAGCRFTPTCSAYALQALDRHGALAGSYLAARRLLRCHPGCKGGIDEVPASCARFTFFPRPGGAPPAAAPVPSSSAAHSPEIAP
jgi:putative membrane protein insertion efficiency factor